MSTEATRAGAGPRSGSGAAASPHGLSRRNLLLSGTTLAAASALGSVTPVRSAQQAQPAGQGGAKPNILVIFGDDIGLANISAYSHGLMGYLTPNIDRIAREGMMFIDYYAEQSCTAGRSTFITGQATLRTGLSKVGMPGAPVGLQDRDPTIAQLLKPLGYATGQFGKNHLGDATNTCRPCTGSTSSSATSITSMPRRSRRTPTTRGTRVFGACSARAACSGARRPTPTIRPSIPRWGRVGKQTIEDTGPLTRKRMETIDDETSDAAVDYMKRQVPPASRSSAGSTPPGCTRARMCGRSIATSRG